MNIVDVETIRAYEIETGKQWAEAEEHMADICSFYDYGFTWNAKGNIAINNGYYCGWHQDYYKFFGKNIEISENENILRHYEYESAADMVEDWIALCKESNVDYIENGMEAPFKWCV